jgi:hypothetical protein
MVMAQIYIMAGQYDSALDELEVVLSVPSFASANQLRLDPFFKPLHDLPRFLAMLAKYDAKNPGS